MDVPHHSKLRAGVRLEIFEKKILRRKSVHYFETAILKNFRKVCIILSQKSVHYFETSLYI